MVMIRIRYFLIVREIVILIKMEWNRILFLRRLMLRDILCKILGLICWFLRLKLKFLVVVFEMLMVGIWSLLLLLVVVCEVLRVWICF